MSAVGQRPTETYQDLPTIHNAIERMYVANLKSTLKKINDSSSIPISISNQGNKRPLQDRLIAHFNRLKQTNMAEHYQESRRILEAEYGSSLSHFPPSRAFNYTPAVSSANINRNVPSHSNWSAQHQDQLSRQRAYLSSMQSYQMHHGSSSMASASTLASNTFLPSVRPHFKSSPFLEVKDWVGPAIICPEAPSSQQKSSTTLKLQLNPSNMELLKRPTAIHQLRLFCTTKTYFDAATNPNHPAPVEFPLLSEVKVNLIPLSVNLKGKKTAAKVLAPHLNKDHALYFGGQDNKVELFYTGTTQKYVLSVAICEIRHADTLARRIKREKVRSKIDVIKAMKVAADDDDIEMGDVSMSLKCPLGAMRMTAPVRSAVCVHMQCFDALSFLSMNEQTPSWQCPICDKTINPDTLFLDGYVLDILEKVPDDEDTVLIDAQGRWHTSNNKFTSEVDEQSKTPLRKAAEPAPVDKVDTKEESNLALPFGPSPPAEESRVESQNKKIVEVFEIDDDDSPLAKEMNWQTDQAQVRVQMEALKRNRAQMIEKQEVEMAREKGSPQPPLQRLPSSSVMMGSGNGSHQSSSREPSQSRTSNSGQQNINSRPFGVALKESPALPSPGLPSLEDVISKPVVEVIDLTLSDSEGDDAMPPPPRRRQDSTVNGHASTSTSSSSLVARPPSLPAAHHSLPQRFSPTLIAAYHSLPQRPSPSLVNSGAHIGTQDALATNGFTRTSPHSRPGNSSLPNQSHNHAPSHSRASSAQSPIPQLPRRRPVSSLDDEDEDEDDSQPIIRHRKKARLRRAYTGSEEGESSSVERSSRGSSSNSERLYEEERAGLAVRS